MTNYTTPDEIMLTPAEIRALRERAEAAEAALAEAQSAPVWKAKQKAEERTVEVRSQLKKAEARAAELERQLNQLTDTSIKIQDYRNRAEIERNAAQARIIELLAQVAQLREALERAKTELDLLKKHYDHMSITYGDYSREPDSDVMDKIDAALSAAPAASACYRHDDCEAYEGLLLMTVAASHKKVVAGIEHAASGQYQSYPSGIIEAGVAKDALTMFENDIITFVKQNAMRPADVEAAKKGGEQ